MQDLTVCRAGAREGETPPHYAVGIESPGNCYSFTAPNYALKPSTQADVLGYRWDLTMGRENTGEPHTTLSAMVGLSGSSRHIYTVQCMCGRFFLTL
jgi:hypothetical protein